MSIRLMSRVFELEIPALEKFVLLAMADHARDDGTGCYPSVGRLARKTSLSERGVQKVIRRLQQKCLLVSTGASRGGRGLTVEYSLTLEKGEPRSPFQKQTLNTDAIETPNTETVKGERGSPESSRTVLAESVVARVEGAKHIDPRAALVEKPVRPSTLFKEVARTKTHNTPPWVKGQLAEQLYRGIHGHAIARAFFDSRFLNPREQLAECVRVGVTTLVTSRVATLKVLDANEIEAAALRKMLPGLETLSLVKDSETRKRQTVQTIVRVIVETCIHMLKARAA